MPDCGTQPTVTSPTNYTELAVGGEGSAIETFVYLPDYTITVEDRFYGIEKEFERGYVQTFPWFRKTRRRLELNFINRSKTERDAIAQFVADRVGSEEVFYFEPEDEDMPIKVCVAQDTIVITKKNPDIYDIKFEVEELY